MGLATSVVDHGAPPERSGPRGGEADAPARGTGAKEPNLEAIAASIWAAPLTERKAMISALPLTVRDALMRHVINPK